MERILLLKQQNLNNYTIKDADGWMQMQTDKISKKKSVYIRSRLFVSPAGRTKVRLILIIGISILYLFLNGLHSFAESDVLDELLAPLYLHEEDLKIKFTSLNRNEFLLKKIIGFLENPLSLPTYTSLLAADLMKCANSIEEHIKNAAVHLEIECNYNAQGKSEDTGYLPVTNEIEEKIVDKKTQQAVSELVRAIFEARHTLERSFARLSNEEIDLLYNNLSLNLLKDHKSPQESELSKWELQWFKENLFLTAEKVDLKEMVRAGILVARAVDSYNSSAGINFGNSKRKSEDIKGDIILQIDSPAGEIVIGGYGDNEYRLNNPVLIIDPGGNDKYLFHNSLKKQVSIIIDHEGDDIYYSKEDFSMGGANFGISILVDREGDDSYRGNNFSQGCGAFGIGILLDEEGNDRYEGDTMVQGAAAFGIGLLIDFKGNDKYTGALMAQGFGYTKGFGGIVDLEGEDEYSSGNKYPDFREPEKAFQSFSQGFGFGYRNYAGGGIGILADYAGDDTYQGSYFTQGSSYWLSLGILYDKEGNDQYHARRYAQGAGIHLSTGIILECSGNDSYSSWGVSQGCGYDFSQGMLVDMKGNDRYLSDWSSQGIGIHSGTGILIDMGGNDSYRGQSRIQGYGVYDDLRDLGSLGLLLDLRGRDTYYPKHEGPSLWHGGRYGGGIDSNRARIRFTKVLDKEIIKFKEVSEGERVRELPPVVPELEREIENDETNRELVEILSGKGPGIVESLVGYLDIKDYYTAKAARESLVAMGRPASVKLCAMLKDGNLAKSKIYYLLYVLGDIKDDASLATFLSFLHSDDPRIRFVSARGIKNLKVKPPLERIAPLAGEESPRIRKYAAEIVGRYRNKKAIDILLKLLKDDNFNVRFAAAEGLKEMGKYVESELKEFIKGSSLPPHIRHLVRSITR